MKAPLLLASTALALVGCSSLTYNRYDPAAPETAAGQMAAEMARAGAERVCGPQGQVTQRDDTDGTRPADWNCERPKP